MEARLLAHQPVCEGSRRRWGWPACGGGSCSYKAGQGWRYEYCRILAATVAAAGRCWTCYLPLTVCFGCPPACRRRGRTLDQDAAEALSGLPQEQQMSIAAGFRNFSEQLS
jgi:hypothetical protein